MTHEPYIPESRSKRKVGFKCPKCAHTAVSLRMLQSHLISRHRMRGEELRSTLDSVEAKTKGAGSNA